MLCGKLLTVPLVANIFSKKHELARFGDFTNLLRSRRIDSDIFSHENISIFRSDVLFHNFWMEFSATGQTVMANLILFSEFCCSV